MRREQVNKTPWGRSALALESGGSNEGGAYRRGWSNRKCSAWSAFEFSGTILVTIQLYATFNHINKSIRIENQHEESEAKVNGEQLVQNALPSSKNAHKMG
jgi:hypothetical protein